jgi:hypothetical protein
MFLTALIVWVVGTLLMELVRPKPHQEAARMPSLGDFNFPTATEGRVIPLIWGEVKITGPNVVWYGHFRAEIITQEVKTGLFSSDDVDTGKRRYYVGIQFALCRGPGVVLKRITVNDKQAYLGSLSADDSAGLILNENLFGGEETGQGGMVGSFHFFPGSTTQLPDAYLSGFQSPTPAYRGTAHVVWTGGYIGGSTSVAPWAFIVRRMVDGLGLAASNPGAEEPYPGGCNPMNVLYELMTDVNWGLRKSPSTIDLTNFRACAVTLAAEGNGFAMVLDGPRNIEELIQEIQRQIDGVVRFNPTTGLWTCTLARDDYDPEDLPLFDESNVLEVVEFTRQLWPETVNLVRVKFADRTKEYNESYGLAQDQANRDLQESTIPVEMSFPGVTDADLANQLAWREWRQQGYPLSRVTLRVNRDGAQLYPGALFRWTSLRLGITAAVFRCNKMNLGGLDSGAIDLFAVEDVFSTGIGSFGAPPASGWTGDIDPALASVAGDTLALEAPRQLVAASPFAPSMEPRIWLGSRWPGGGTLGFDVYARAGTSRPLTGGWSLDQQINAFLVVGVLDADVAAYGATATRPAVSYTIDVEATDDLLGLLVDGGTALVSNLLTIAYVDGEYLGYQQVTDLGGGIYRLAGLHRGLFHTAPKKHAAGTRIWFLGQSGGGLSRLAMTSSQDEVDFQLRSRDVLGTMAEGLIPIKQVSLATLWRCPLAPRDPVLHSSYAPATTSLDVQYTTETGRTGEDARALKIAVTPRSWAVDDVVTDATLPANYLDDSPEFDFELDLGVTSTPVITVGGTDSPVAYVVRNAVIGAAGANNPIPATGTVRVAARHTVGGTDYTNPVPMEFEVGLTSALQDDDLLHGALTVNVAGTAVVYGETGTYNFNIGTALPSSGILEASKNGGGYTTVVAAASSTGTLAVTTGDSVVLRFTQAPAASQFFTVLGPTAEVGHGVLKA